MNDDATKPPFDVYEHRMRVWGASVEARAAMFAAHTQAVTGYATAAINAAILLNSAAAGAVLALLGALWGGDPHALAIAIGTASRSIALFAAGAILAAASAILAYFCQSWVAVDDLAQLRIDTDNNMNGAGSARPEDIARQARGKRLGDIFRVAAIIAGVASVVAFGTGALFGVDALLLVRDVFGA